MRLSLAILCLLLSCQGNEVQNGSPKIVPDRNESDLAMIAGTDLAIPTVDDSAQQKTLIGGTVADIKNYPANFYTSQGNSKCSGTLIGERVLSTAAHCVGNGKTAQLAYNGVTYSGVCTHHPDYKTNDTADWALCVMDKPVPVVAYENVIPDIALLKVGDTVELTGFGCTNPDGSGGNDGSFRFGRVAIKDLPSGTNHDVHTVGSVALCFGDSGGSAYFYQGENRYQFANNSRGDIHKESWLSSFTINFKTWATKWQADKSVDICGMSALAKGCRGTKPPEPPSLCAEAYKTFGDCIGGLAQTQRDVCRKIYGTLFACLEEAERAE